MRDGRLQERVKSPLCPVLPGLQAIEPERVWAMEAGATWTSRDAVDGVLYSLNLGVLTCPADGLWPETVHSTYNLMIPCAAGYSGSMYRSCSSTGQWSEVNDQYCGRIDALLS